uniref:Uncharacterized protein CG42248 n=3 Tax=Anthurium amnicola TaxID=1678845 RepID=A0A1D1YGI4_9ARAE
MGHQGHEQVYLSLSRKELQGLCKQHGLPANRSNIDLARSLESLFRRTNSSQSQSKEALDMLPSSESKPKDQNNYSRETDTDFGREYVARKNSSKAGTYRRIACLKESVKRDSLTANQLEIDCQVTNQSTEQAFDRVANVGSACPSNYGTTEDFGGSTSGPGNPHHLSATDVQDIVACPQSSLQCHEICNRNISGKISELKNNHHSLQSSVATSSGMCSLPLAPCGPKKFGECFPGSGFVTPNATISPVPPAFQFFVASEDGVNLFVDLCSTPSDWIRSLKDEVCISQESYHRKSLTIRHEIKCLSDATKNLKTSTDIIEADSQLRGSGSSSGCVNSSLSSISEICNSVAQPANNDTPRSSVLTSNRSPVVLSGRLDEVSHVVSLSSSCTAYAYVKNFMVSDILPCPGAVPNSDGNFLLLERSNASPLDGSLSKSSCKLQVNLEADRLKKFDQMEHQTLEAGSVCSQDIEEGFSGHMSESASEKSSLSLSSERCEISGPLDTCSNQNHSGGCQLSPTSDSKKVNLLEHANHKRAKSTPCQIHSRQKLACPLNDMELDESQLTNQMLDQHACVNPVPEITASTFSKELESGFSSKETEDPECPHSIKLLVKTCKRSHILEHEDFQSKKQQTSGENRNGAAFNLRSAKAYLKESNCDPLVLPRRSIRLMSK